jgi:hypothetical protein
VLSIWDHQIADRLDEAIVQQESVRLDIAPLHVGQVIETLDAEHEWAGLVIATDLAVASR